MRPGAKRARVVPYISCEAAGRERANRASSSITIIEENGGAIVHHMCPCSETARLIRRIGSQFGWCHCGDRGATVQAIVEQHRVSVSDNVRPLNQARKRPRGRKRTPER